MNDLFSGEFSDNDYIAFATAISGKLKEDQTLVQQAKNNEEGQFGSSPTLRSSTESAVMDALATHTEMSKQVLSSSEKLNGLIAALMGAGQLYQSLRA